MDARFAINLKFAPEEKRYSKSIGEFTARETDGSLLQRYLRRASLRA